MDTPRLDALRQLIGSYGDRRLPSVRRLAAMWAIAPNSAQSLLREARRRGWIETRAGSGSWAAGRMPRRQSPPPRAGAEDVAAAIRDEIRNGRWTGGERLPPPKDLASRRGLHAATLRKVLRRLEGENLLQRRGHAWFVSAPRKKSGLPSILLCLAAREDEGRMRLGSDREWDFWREIQAEAARNGLRPELRTWNGRLPDSAAHSMGAVVSTWHLADPFPLLKALHRARLRSAVWLENPAFPHGRPPLASPWLGFHDMAYGRASGTICGRHPAIRRHSRIAWISPFHGAEWARNRLEGLRGSLPGDCALHAALGPWTSEWDLQEAVWSDPKSWKRLRLKGIGAPDRYPDIARPLMEAIGRDRLLARFDSALEKALASRSTLWVAASDPIAIWCLDWLAARGLRVPRDIALAGFDDSRDALRHDLTSFRFDAQSMARAMVRQVLAPAGLRRAVFGYPGTVVPRGSTPYPE